MMKQSKRKIEMFGNKKTLGKNSKQPIKDDKLRLSPLARNGRLKRKKTVEKVNDDDDEEKKRLAILRKKLEKFWKKKT